MERITIDEKISLSQYKEIQTFYFYKKQHRDIWIIAAAIFGLLIAGVNVYSTGKIAVGAVVFVLLPIVCVVLTNLRISGVVKKLYDKDIKEWHLVMTSDHITAKANQMKQGMKINDSQWYRAYELDNVILLYFTPEQFITISKSELSSEELMTIKGWIYDKIGDRFKLKKARMATK